jgi:hypothetical protein
MTTKCLGKNRTKGENSTNDAKMDKIEILSQQNNYTPVIQLCTINRKKQNKNKHVQVVLLKQQLKQQHQ